MNLIQEVESSVLYVMQAVQVVIEDWFGKCHCMHSSQTDQKPPQARSRFQKGTLSYNTFAKVLKNIHCMSEEAWKTAKILVGTANCGWRSQFYIPAILQQKTLVWLTSWLRVFILFVLTRGWISSAIPMGLSSHGGNWIGIFMDIDSTLIPRWLIIQYTNIESRLMKSRLMKYSFSMMQMNL